MPQYRRKNGGNIKLKLFVSDLDRVIVDPAKRFEVATENGKINWERALSSELLHLDTLIPGAVEHLDFVARNYDHTILLTSRYDHMREGTEEWLQRHGVLVPAYRLIMKPFDKRFQKTKQWKAWRVLELLREYGNPGLFDAPQEAVTGLLVVDDDDKNQEAINDLLSENMSNLRLEYSVFRSSLQDAVEWVKKGIRL